MTENPIANLRIGIMNKYVSFKLNSSTNSFIKSICFFIFIIVFYLIYFFKALFIWDSKTRHHQLLFYYLLFLGWYFKLRKFSNKNIC